MSPSLSAILSQIHDDSPRRRAGLEALRAMSAGEQVLSIFGVLANKIRQTRYEPVT